MPAFTGLPAGTVASATVMAGDVGGVTSKFTAQDVANLSTAGVKVIQLACSDESTALTTGTAKITFRMPYAMTLNAGTAGIRASLTTAQASGSIFTVDVKQGGSTILSTLITIDNTEKTSTTAVALPVISTTALTDDASITVDITQVGASGATGLKVSLIGT